MTSMWVGVSGLQASQNAINTTSHNITNAGTLGYVRQQVLLQDFGYNRVGQSANYSHNVGLGVATEVVKQARDQFLDTRYRKEVGRQGYYDAQYNAIREVEDIFGELEGVSFQIPMTDMRNALQEMANDPGNDTVRATFVKKAEAFLERASKMSQQVKDYQVSLNSQITDKVNRINQLGENIKALNLEIRKNEAGGIERANDLRDSRNSCLDELGQLIDITYYEDVDGMVNVMAEGNSFVNRETVFKMGLTTEKPNLRQVKDLSDRIYSLNSQIKSEKAGGNDAAKIAQLEKDREDILKLLDKYVDFEVTYNTTEDGVTQDGTINVTTLDGTLVNGKLDAAYITNAANQGADSLADSILNEITQAGNNIHSLNEKIKEILAANPAADVTALEAERDNEYNRISAHIPCSAVANPDGTIDVTATGFGKLVIGNPGPTETAGFNTAVAADVRNDIAANINTAANEIISLNERVKEAILKGEPTATIDALKAQRDAELAKITGYGLNLDVQNNDDGTINVKTSNGGTFIIGDVGEYTAVNRTVAEKLCDTTKMLKPIWLSTNEDVYNFDKNPSQAAGTDCGSLKGLLISRGSDEVNYTDIPIRNNFPSNETYLAAVEAYNIEIQSSIISTSQAQFDQLIHGMLTAMNNIFAPNKEIELADGTKITVLDEENAPVGMDENHTQGEELFVRKGMPRYTTKTVKTFELDAAGQKIPDATDPTGFLTKDVQVREYNKEDPNNAYSLYTIGQTEINTEILKNYSKLPLTSNKDHTAFDKKVTDKLINMYNEKFLPLGPNNSTMNTYDNYYTNFIGELANRGNTLKNIAGAQETSVNQIDNARSSVMGVSTDEELTNLIKYQHAYNASARYVNVVSEMLEHLVTRL